LKLDAFEAASAAEGEALDALRKRSATTIAGARAAIEHVMATEDAQQVRSGGASIQQNPGMGASILSARHR
jgi:hypothetical protein